MVRACDNSVTIALAYAPEAVAYAASSRFLLARMQLSQTCDNCFLAIRVTIVSSGPREIYFSKEDVFLF